MNLKQLLTLIRAKTLALLDLTAEQIGTIIAGAADMTGLAPEDVKTANETLIALYQTLPADAPAAEKARLAGAWQATVEKMNSDAADAERIAKMEEALKPVDPTPAADAPATDSAPTDAPVADLPTINPEGTQVPVMASRKKIDPYQIGPTAITAARAGVDGNSEPGSPLTPEKFARGLANRFGSIVNAAGAVEYQPFAVVSAYPIPESDPARLSNRNSSYMNNAIIADALENQVEKEIPAGVSAARKIWCGPVESSMSLDVLGTGGRPIFEALRKVPAARGQFRFRPDIAIDRTAVSGTSASVTTNASKDVTGLASTLNLRPNQPVSGTGIVVGTRIEKILSATSIRLDTAATATGTPTLTFGGMPNFVQWNPDTNTPDCNTFEYSSPTCLSDEQLVQIGFFRRGFEHTNTQEITDPEGLAAAMKKDLIEYDRWMEQIYMGLLQGFALNSSTYYKWAQASTYGAVPDMINLMFATTAEVGWNGRFERGGYTCFMPAGLEDWMFVDETASAYPGTVGSAQLREALSKRRIKTVEYRDDPVLGSNPLNGPVYDQPIGSSGVVTTGSQVALLPQPIGTFRLFFVPDGLVVADTGATEIGPDKTTLKECDVVRTIVTKREMPFLRDTNRPVFSVDVTTKFNGSRAGAVTPR